MIKLKTLLKEQLQKILKKGSRGDSVKALQQKLIKLKFLEPKTVSGKDAADGIFGSGTKAAVIKFQKSAFPGQTKEHDGIVGKDTRIALSSKSKSKQDKPNDVSKTYDNLDNSKDIINALHKSTSGVGTSSEEGLKKSIFQIKNLDQLNKINNILRTSQYLYDQNPPNTMVTLKNGSTVNTDWLDGYSSVSAIVNGELGIFDQTLKTQILQYIANIRKPQTLSKGIGYGIALSWPTYQPSLDKGTLKTIGTVQQTFNKKADLNVDFNGIMKSIWGDDYKEGSVGPAGHGGVAIVKMDGTVILAEFGRYGGANKDEGKKWFLTQKEGKEFSSVFENENGRKPTYKDIPDDAIGTYGVVKKKSLGKIAKIANNKISNLDSVLSIIKRNSQGDGPALPMEGLVVSNFDVTGGLKFISGFKTREYVLFDFNTGGGSNCATFVVDTMIAGKTGASGKCFPNIQFNLEYLKTLPNAIQFGKA